MFHVKQLGGDNMSIYLNNGYIDMDSLFLHEARFVTITGARGTGKTYGASMFLLTVCNNDTQFIWLRRTSTEADIISTTDSSPFKKYCLDNDIALPEVKRVSKQVSGVFVNDECIGFICGLSTFSNIRGAEGLFAKVQYAFYDEFIPEPHVRKMKGEYHAILNFYETVNRNRELQGDDALKLVMASNSNDIANPWFMGLEIVDNIVKLQKKQQEKAYYPDRDLLIINIMKSKISERKSKTALYKLNKESSFNDMALSNFFDMDNTNISSRRLKDYIPVVKYGEMCIYIKKDESEFYVNCHCVGNVREIKYGTKDAEVYFKRTYGYVMASHIFNHDVIFENQTARILFEKAFE